MARIATIKEALHLYLFEKGEHTDVWFQRPYRNICANVGNRLLVIWFEVHYAWPDDVDEIRKRLESEAVYEALLDVADPVATVLKWTPNGFRIHPKVLK